MPPISISDGFDVTLLGDADDIIEFLCNKLQWQLCDSDNDTLECSEINVKADSLIISNNNDNNIIRKNQKNILENITKIDKLPLSKKRKSNVYLDENNDSSHFEEEILNFVKDTNIKMWKCLKVEERIFQITNNKSDSC